MEWSRRGYYPEAMKRRVVSQVELGEISQTEANRRYGILGHSTVLKWCRKYGKQQSGRGAGTGMGEKDIELLCLQNENKALRQELDDARFKNVVLETLVDVAERELKIPIRKKFGAKQSLK